MNWFDIFDYDDGNLIWKSNTNLRGSRDNGKIAGTLSSRRRARVRHIIVHCRKKRYYAHRIVWEMFNGPIDTSMQVDHIDGDGLNNKLENLRLVSASGNRKNQPLRVDNKSGLFGVRWVDQRNFFEAYIDSGGKRKRLGSHETLFEAVCVRKKAELDYNFHMNHGRVSVEESLKMDENSR